MDIKKLIKRGKEYREKYNAEHKYCPKCFSTDESYEFYEKPMMDLRRLDKYIDLNVCTCVYCNHVHTKHERVGSVLTINTFRNNSFKIDASKIKTLDDIKLILEAMELTFNPKSEEEKKRMCHLFF